MDDTVSDLLRHRDESSPPKVASANSPSSPSACWSPSLPAASASLSGEPTLYSPASRTSTTPRTSPSEIYYPSLAYSPKAQRSSRASLSSYHSHGGSSGAVRSSLYGDTSNLSANTVKSVSSHPRPDHAPPSHHVQDLEKADSKRPSIVHHIDPQASQSSPAKVSCIGDDIEGHEDVDEHVAWILVRKPYSYISLVLKLIIPAQIYLSFLSPLLTVIISIYALVATTILLFLSPLLLFPNHRKRLAFTFSLLLALPVRLQLRLVFSWTSEEKFHPENGKPVRLALIGIFSPIYAAGIAVFAWVTAGFWVTAAVLGDPDGTDNRDDGRAAVLGVRFFWKKWLTWGLRRHGV